MFGEDVGGGGGGWRDESREMYREGVGSLEGRSWGGVAKMKESRGREAAQWLRERNRVRFQGVGWEEWICWERFPFSYPSGLLVPGSFLQNLERTPGFLALRSFQLFCSRREWGFWG